MTSIYNKEHKNAQVVSAQELLTFASAHKVSTEAVCELIIKSYGLQCQVKLGKPRELMLSHKPMATLIDLAIKEAEHLYGARFDNDTSKSLVAKQAIYLLCGRDKSNRVKESCQEWRNKAIEAYLAEPEKATKPASKPRSKKTAATKAA